MNSALKRCWSAWSWLFCACLLCMSSISLVGCASGVAGDGGFLTDSDEPEARRRARIRLELAAAYFEQGQTTVALDELKQSMGADPNYAQAHNLRGLIYMRLNDLLTSQESFQRALALNPRDGAVMHNLGWLYCQQALYVQAQQMFFQALTDPRYRERAKTLRAQGLCQLREGKFDDGEHSLLKSYELDALNPVTAYNLASLLFQRGNFERAQPIVRRLNNTELANAESLWLGIRVERRLNQREIMMQLGSQLAKRFPASREFDLYQRGAFDE